MKKEPRMRSIKHSNNCVRCSKNEKQLWLIKFKQMSTNMLEYSQTCVQGQILEFICLQRNVGTVKKRNRKIGCKITNNRCTLQPKQFVRSGLPVVNFTYFTTTWADGRVDGLQTTVFVRGGLVLAFHYLSITSVFFSGNKRFLTD